MFGLHSLTNIAFGHISCNLSFHASPPKFLLQVLVHLVATRMDRKLRFMGFIKNFLSKLKVLGNYQTFPKPKNSLIIELETLDLVFIDSSSKFHHAFIFKLSLLDFINEIRGDN